MASQDRLDCEAGKFEQFTAATGNGSYLLWINLLGQ